MYGEVTRRISNVRTPRGRTIKVAFEPLRRHWRIEPGGYTRHALPDTLAQATRSSRNAEWIVQLDERLHTACLATSGCAPPQFLQPSSFGARGRASTFDVEPQRPARSRDEPWRQRLPCAAPQWPQIATDRPRIARGGPAWTLVDPERQSDRRARSRGPDRLDGVAGSLLRRGYGGGITGRPRQCESRRMTRPSSATYSIS